MPEPEARMTLTLKFPEEQRYQGAPWVVFHGNVPSIRADILEYMGWPAHEFEGMSLHELTVAAQQGVRGMLTLANTLGATPMTASQQSEQPTSQAVEKPTEDDLSWLVAKIEQAGDIDALKLVWAQNQDKFKDTAVMAAYKARGKALRDAEEKK